MADIYVFMIFRKIQSIKFYKSENLTEKDKNNWKSVLFQKYFTYICIVITM